MAHSPKTETEVTVCCPRCAGQGGSKHWHPDANVCYLCFGRGDLRVNKIGRAHV